MKRKNVSAIQVKRTPAGKLTFKLSTIIMGALREELYLLLSTPYKKKRTVDELGAKLFAEVLQQWGATIDWDTYHHQGYRTIRATDAQACALILALMPSTNPYMIELKAALLKAL